MASRPRILIVLEGGSADREAAEVGLALAAAGGGVAVLLAFVPTTDPRTPRRAGPLAHVLAQEVEPDKYEEDLAWATMLARERGVPCETRVIATNARRLATRGAAERLHASRIVVAAEGGPIRRRRSLAHDTLAHARGPAVVVTSADGQRS